MVVDGDSIGDDGDVDVDDAADDDDSDDNDAEDADDDDIIYFNIDVQIPR